MLITELENLISEFLQLTLITFTFNGLGTLIFAQFEITGKKEVSPETWAQISLWFVNHEHTARLG